MHIYLLRHGQAENHARSGRDEDRALTARGREQIAQLAHKIRNHGLHFDRIFTSPYTRALETAEIISETLGAKIGPEKQNWLGCGLHFETFCDEINALEGVEHVLLVGHMPDLGEILGQLLQSNRAFAMKPGSLCEVKVDLPIHPNRFGQLGLYWDP